MRYAISYRVETRAHMAVIEKKHRGLIVDTVANQLRHEPLRPTRNRKPLEGETILGSDTWEIRFGPGNRFRVFYRVVGPVVEVIAIGVKVGSTLRIGGEEVDL